MLQALRALQALQLGAQESGQRRLLGVSAEPLQLPQQILQMPLEHFVAQRRLLLVWLRWG